MSEIKKGHWLPCFRSGGKGSRGAVRQEREVKSRRRSDLPLVVER